MQEDSILSTGKAVVASTKGDQGPPSAITSKNIEDWKLDRWGVSDLTKAENAWVETDLGEPHFISQIEIVWESAYASQYLIETKVRKTDPEWVRFGNLVLSLASHPILFNCALTCVRS